MTAIELYQRLLARAAVLAGKPVFLSASDFVRLTRSVMDNINGTWPVNMTRVKGYTRQNARYLVMPNDITGIVRASINGERLGQERPVQFDGCADTLSDDGAADTPVVVWREDDVVRRLVLFGFDPRPDRAYLVRYIVNKSIPLLTDATKELPLHPAAHEAVFLGMMSAMTMNEDFHLKSFHVEFETKYTDEVAGLARLSSFRAYSQGDVRQRFRADTGESWF